MGGGGDGQDVIEAHRYVGHDDDPDRLPHGRAVPHVAGALFLRTDQLDGDPDENQSSDELKKGDPEQEADDGDEHQA
jgi:hypothetical protein